MISKTCIIKCVSAGQIYWMNMLKSVSRSKFAKVLGSLARVSAQASGPKCHCPPSLHAIPHLQKSLTSTLEHNLQLYPEIVR
jgi:hypothetical protein